jgi:hypothetical protein
MRAAFAAAAALAAVAVAGCGDPAQPAADYLKTGLAAKQQAVVVTDSWQTDQKIQAFRAKQGRDPQSLEELEASEGKLQAPPGKHWVYDAATARLALADD